MKYLHVALVALALAAGSGAPAEARRGGGGSAEFMEFIAETPIPDRETGQDLALCHLIKKYHAIFIPLWYESEGYALAVNRCDSDSYYSVEPEMLAEGKEQGFFPADLPSAPSLSLAQAGTPFMWGALIVLGLGFQFFRRGGSASRGAVRSSSAPNFSARVLEVASRAALADGQVEEREIAMITSIASSFSTNTVEPTRMRQMVDYVRQQPEPADYTDLGTGLGEMERDQLMRVAMLVIGKGNLADGPGRAFLDKLAMGLLIEPARRDALAAAL